MYWDKKTTTNNNRLQNPLFKNRTFLSFCSEQTILQSCYSAEGKFHIIMKDSNQAYNFPHSLEENKTLYFRTLGKFKSGSEFQSTLERNISFTALREGKFHSSLPCFSCFRIAIHFLCNCMLVRFQFGHVNIGIKHAFPCINICQVPREVLKTEVEDRSFQLFPRDRANVNALENHVWSLLLHKNILWDKKTR